ncbi:alpha-amylase family glycosyl hydrolase [Ferruginibacter sp. HRS2-29]|uniref:alpha-amylase family glycosyl hydrolase n=1 Tax=Ferruginibacter sp. HRS2-29 TaxID=2487334 RepID=UPI0020CDD982|nr:alpha-amylase family glycosyl hydrolase [Ferruginibacter sp. HRS2-29]MCP9749516.1 DUF3459 domain-containing protein [Ferruginibacter sp. HRS2-29]
MQQTGIFPRAGWINSTNVYEVNVRQYTPEGTFNAFFDEMPRLRAMGVETLWFMPITPIAQQHKKGTMGSPYACSDYTAVNPEFGTLADFISLVKGAQALGFKVIIDWVANHTGWDHVWTTTNPSYYQHDETTGTFKVASGMDDIIELDYDNADMRIAMIESMRYWITTAGIDGFRCDLASWVRVDFWQQARTALEETKNLFWLAEMDPIESREYMEVFDAAYTWKWMHSTEDFYKKQLPLNTLTQLLQDYNDRAGDHPVKLWFTSNHDENSWNGTEYEKYGDSALLFAVHSFTWDGIPLIYSGQELPNHKRLQFFDKDVIAWNGEYHMAAFYSTLLSLRRRNAALHAADDAVTTYLPATGSGEKVLAYLRSNGRQEVFVLLNFSPEESTIYLSDPVVKGKFSNVFFPQDHLELPLDEAFVMRPWQYLVYEKG